MADFPMPVSENIWDLKYRLKRADGSVVDKTVEDTWLRVAKALAQAEETEELREEWTERFYEVLEDWKFTPAGRIVAGAGTGRAVTLFNCYVMGTIPDSMSGIFTHLREAALTMQQGGGIGYDFSTIRPRSSWVKGVDSDASGPLSFMDCWDAMCRTVMSAGSRRGAMMATMRCDHPDIRDFVSAKKDAARLRMFNMSVLVTDAFMEAVEADAEWPLVHIEPPTVSDKTILDHDGYSEKHGDSLPRYVHDTVRARDLWDEIMQATYDYAEPGVIFIDRVNGLNNLRRIETIASTNPCGEQPLPPYGACLLGSINLARFVTKAFQSGAGIDWSDLGQTVRVAMRMLDNVVDVSNFPLPQQEAEAKAKRRVGLGVTGLADMLVMLGVIYGSDEAVEIVDDVMGFIADESILASAMLAKEKGPFPAFDLDNALEPGTFVSTRSEEVTAAVAEHGMRNSHTTSIAPTGTISLYAGNVSGGIEPIFAGEFTRKVLQKDGSKVEEKVRDYALHLWAEEARPTKFPKGWVTAQDLSPAAHVRMQAAAQAHVDSSISKTVNVPKDIPFDEFKGVYELAFKLGCKGCTTYRPNDVTGSVLTVDEAPKVSHEEMLDTARSFLNGEMGVDRAKAQKTVLTFLDEAGVEKVKDIPEDKRDAFMLYLKTASAEPVPHLSPGADLNVQEAPLDARPDDLPGRVYKIKMGDTSAVYVTITDIEIDGQCRPFEVFISSRDPAHFEWTTALTRMISAVFRRPHDSSFVVEELKAVFSPAGGGFWKGAYRQSMVAAIGQVIEDHMRSIGYGSFSPATVEAKPVPEVEVKGKLCPKCHGSNVQVVGGCPSCPDCGWSKCG